MDDPWLRIEVELRSSNRIIPFEALIRPSSFFAGAYGFTMSNQYNARLRPAEVLLFMNEFKLIRKRETLEDLTRNEIEIEELY
jgi:DNA relaxase NicK